MGGRQSTQGPPSYRVWGEGEARATVLVLHTFEMHVDLSFSYLRFAEAASFDKKELRRSCTPHNQFICHWSIFSCVHSSWDVGKNPRRWYTLYKLSKQFEESVSFPTPTLFGLFHYWLLFPNGSSPGSKNESQTTSIMAYLIKSY